MRVILLIIINFFYISLYGNKKINISKSRPDSLFWKITHSKLNGVSYLFGSIHIIDKQHFILPDSALQCLKKSNVLVTEIDLNDKAALASSYDQLLLPQGYGILDYISMNELQKLDSIWRSMKFTEFEIMSFKMMKPIFWSAAVMNKLIKDPHEGFDQYFTSKAEVFNKRIIGLETPAFALKQIEALPIQMQYDEVIKTLKNIKSSKKELNKLFTLYTKRDIHGLMKIINEGLVSMPGLEEKILIERNEFWFQRLKILLESNNCFIVVGAAHLFGGNGLIKMFEKEGFIVTPFRR